MAMPQRARSESTFTRDGLFELASGVGLAGAGYLLRPAPPESDLALWAFAPLLAAALLLPGLKALLRWIAPASQGHRSAGWGWLLGAILALALGAAGLVLVWLEVDSPLLGVVIAAAQAIVGHATASLGLVIGLSLILTGFANGHWRVALEGMCWGVVGFAIDAAIWGQLLPLWFVAMWSIRRAASLYLAALGGLTTLLGLIALARFIVQRPRAAQHEVGIVSWEEANE